MILFILIVSVLGRLVPNKHACVPSNTDSLLPLAEQISRNFGFNDFWAAKGQLSMSEIINFYGYAKQAIKDDVVGSRPPFWDVTGKL